MKDEKVLASPSWEFIDVAYDLQQWKKKTLKELKKALVKECISRALIRNGLNVIHSSEELGESR